jgi:acyl-CoA thioester hydrolase
MRWRVRVRYYEVDEYGHVNHANYVHYLETARIEALEAVGLSLKDMRRRGVMAVAADLAVKYHSPAGPGDTLEIMTHVSEIRGARTRWVQEIRESTGGRLVATAAVTGAFLTEEGRPLRAPEEFRKRLETLYVPPRPGVVENAMTTPLPNGSNGSGTNDSRCVCRRGGLGATLRGILGGRR